LVCSCIDSILRQTYAPAEIILVDDGSSDDTVSAVSRRYGAKVIVASLPHSGLPAVSRNEGIRIAGGEYVAFCDSDDLWNPNKLEIQMDMLTPGNYNFTCSNAAVLGEKSDYFKNYKFPYADMKKNLMADNFVITSSVLMRKDLLRGSGFSVSRYLRGYEDYALWLKLSSKLSIYYSSTSLLQYRKHSGSLSADVRLRDSIIQLRLLAANRASLRHPFIALKKAAKYSYRALNEIIKKNIF
jgi:glycosyltransferase involved in cell wall biosynthesis